MIRNEADGCYLVKGFANTEDPETEFALRMATENGIRHLLRPEVRTFNGEKKLYFEIGGKQSLEAASRVRALTGADLSNLFGSLYALLEDLPGFFLHAGGVILSSEEIFTDGETFFFLYDFDPDSPLETDGSGMAKAHGEGSLDRFARELLEMIDHNDEDAVVYAYQFHRAVTEGNPDLKQILERVMVDEDAEESSDEYDKEECSFGMMYGERDQGIPDEGGGELWEEPSDREAGERKKPDLFLLIVTVLLCLMGAALLCWRLMQTTPFDVRQLLTREGIGGLVFLLTGFLGLFILLFKNRGSGLSK